MARRKLITSPNRQAPWLYTFADLMNLLLCFFIMIVALSNINTDKFEKASISIANSIGITKSNTGAKKDALIQPGMKQVNGIDQYMGMLNEGTGKDNANNSDNNQSIANDSSQNTKNNDKTDINEALAKINQEMAAATSKMYNEVSDLTEQYNLNDYVELSMDPNNKYVELTLKGSVLYDSGQAEIKKEALPILTSIGNIIKKFNGYSVEITGYTDNVPITGSSDFKDNNWLSSARALNAAEYLIKECEINPSKLKYSGRGEYEPISSNATEQGRAKNRRIEFKIYNEYSSE